MFVAASTNCFAGLTLNAALQKLADLEYTRVEIALKEDGQQLRPSEVHADLERAISLCRETHRLTPVAYSFDQVGEGEAHFAVFASCCRLAKATKVAVITVPSAELGTPFNAEIERLKELVRIANLEGVRVGLKTEVGRMSQDPTTAAVLCDNVRGLAITLDPSHFVFDSPFDGRYEPVLKYVCHVVLRDTNKKQFQVRVGQGLIEYGRLVSQLSKYKYDRALCVDIVDLLDPDIDHLGEMRKMRLLLESLL